MAKYIQGQFKPRNPGKYKGDFTNIIYRSSWELKLMMWCDNSPLVVKWSSEETVIPYRSPLDGKIHRYFVDFWIKKIDDKGKAAEFLVEVKPSTQVAEPKVQKKVTKKYINEVMTYGVNQAKWTAARKYCAERGWSFEIMTEKELGIK